jgi:hypothetical protein
MRRALRVSALAGFALIAAVPSCSLLGLDDFDTTPCATDADCAAANAKYPPEGDPCGAYVCRSGSCIMEERVESCDGQDNDCNGAIDDGIAPAPSTLLGEMPCRVSVGHASVPARGEVYVAVGEPSNALHRIVNGERTETLPLAYDSADADHETGEPCPTEDGPKLCNFAEVAVGSDGQTLVYVGVNRLGCGDGQIRIGMSDRSEPEAVWLGRSAGARADFESNIAYGVDIGGAKNCTGNSLAPGFPPGASRPAVAVIDMKPGAAGALALWRAWPTPFDGLTCDEPGASPDCGNAVPAPIQALGLFVPSGRSEQDGVSLTGKNAGVPSVLGESTSESAPAVVPYQRGDTKGYLVAFAGHYGEQQGVQLLFVDADGTPSEPLHLIEDAGADRVSLATAENGTDEPDVGVAWSSGCGAERRLKFSVIRRLGAQADETPVLNEAADVIFTPQVLYTAGGFGTGVGAGGWSVLWVSKTDGNTRELKFARAADGAGEVPTIATLRSGAVGYAVMSPRDDSSLGYALVHKAEDPDELSVVSRWCSESD